MDEHNKKDKLKKLPYMDIVRALCTLWIVGFWHLSNHSTFTNQILLAPKITGCVLFCFMFISGYLVSQREVNTWNDVKSFYIRRFLRFYPLFFLSCTLLLLMNIFYRQQYITSIRQYVLTLLGLSYIILPAPSTVYFISLLILFYAFTPLVEKAGRGGIFLVVGFYMGLYVLYRLSNMKYVHGVLFDFMIFYFTGVFLRGVEFRYSNKVLVISLVLFILFLYLSDIVENSFYVRVLSDFYYAFYISFLIEVCIFTDKYLPWLEKLMSFISFGSMCAYLFHRPIYWTLNILFGPFSPVFAYLFSLPLLLIISYFIQLIYNGILTLIQNKFTDRGRKIE